MNRLLNWDWDSKEKLICIDEWEKRFPVVHEFFVSDDGEKIAAVVEIENKKVTPCVNGTTWKDTFERIWSLRFTPDERLAS